MTEFPAGAPSAPLHPQLFLLMELQDLRAQQKEFATAGGAGAMEAKHFHLVPEDARAQLGAKIEELVEGLSPPVLARYRKMIPQRDRVVVPVIEGVCYGCFVQIPSAQSSDQDVNDTLRSCENCGCFLYVVH